MTEQKNKKVSVVLWVVTIALLIFGVLVFIQSRESSKELQRYRDLIAEVDAENVELKRKLDSLTGEISSLDSLMIESLSRDSVLQDKQSKAINHEKINSIYHLPNDSSLVYFREWTDSIKLARFFGVFSY